MMKNYLRAEVLSAAKRCGVTLAEIAPERAESLRKQVSQKYAHGNDSWLWEALDECVVLIDEHHWDPVGECVAERELVLFFNGDEDRSMFRLDSGQDLSKVLGESFRFEYYVTDDATSYLIAVNHHNVIHAVGAAEAWLQKIKYR